MVVSSTSSGPFIKSTTPYSEINLQIASQWGSLVRGVSTDRRMALQVINHSFFFLCLFLFYTVRCFRSLLELSSSSKIPRRANTLCYLPAAKKKIVYSLFFVAVGLKPLIKTKRSMVTSHCLLDRVARFDAPATNSSTFFFLF